MGLFVHYFKERASRMQSESSLSGFAEAKPLFEAQPQRTLSSGVLFFRRCKGRIQFIQLKIFSRLNSQLNAKTARKPFVCRGNKKIRKKFSRHPN